MFSQTRFCVLAPLLLCLTLPTRADELADKGREVFKQHQRAVVTVQVVQKMTYSSGGRTSEPQESKQDITGTVVDASGLTVLALSACDPSEMYKRMMSDTSRYKIESEVSDVKILLDDGGEIPAEIVLRDKDLDLAFIRPKAKQTAAMAAVDLGKSAPAQVLDQVVTLNRLGRAAGRAHSASVERISAVVQKPRTFYIPDSTMTATALGSPAFALDGNIVGLIVMRTLTASSGPSMNNFRPDNATSIILPAEDVLKAAKQAPEAKGDDEKKSDAKEPKEKKEEK
jgi:hypothetical protein